MCINICKKQEGVFMKKVFAVILCVVMLFSVMSLGVSAYTINKDDAQIGAGDIFGTTAVYFDDATVKAGETVSVELMLESNPGLTELNVDFDLPEGITIDLVVAGDLGTVTSSDTSVTLASDEVITNEGCVAVITFKADASASGEKKITLTATAKNEEDIVKVNGSSCIINVTASAVIEVKGDVNGDGKMDTTDLAVLKIFLATEEKTEAVVNPDVNGDEFANTTDLAALKLMLAEG